MGVVGREIRGTLGQKIMGMRWDRLAFFWVHLCRDCALIIWDCNPRLRADLPHSDIVRVESCDSFPSTSLLFFQSPRLSPNLLSSSPPRCSLSFAPRCDIQWIVLFFHPRLSSPGPSSASRARPRSDPPPCQWTPDHRGRNTRTVPTFDRVGSEHSWRMTAGLCRSRPLGETGDGACMQADRGCFENAFDCPCLGTVVVDSTATE